MSKMIVGMTRARSDDVVAGETAVMRQLLWICDW
jgi:hypothetical protein